MKIHRVKSGETIFSIAREYSVPPTKIIENNGLLHPDKLSVGEELLILTPTRTYTVRGSDTLRRVADRFSVKCSSIVAKNPSLLGGEKLYPGQILTLKNDTPPYGLAFGHGYYYNGTPIERLHCVLPYLTYVSVCAARVKGDDVKLMFDDSRAVKEIRDAGKIPLLQIYCDDRRCELDDAMRDTAILLAKARGYGGINLCMSRADCDCEAYSKFLLELKRTLLEYDLLLFVELDENKDCRVLESYDGAILSYSKAQMNEPPSFKNGELLTFEKFADNYETSKAYVELSPFAFAGDEVILREDAMKIAYTNKCEIAYDEGTKLCYFDYNKYTRGQKIPTRVVFESLENIKAKLDLVDELGYMGVSVDIMRVPMSYLLMFDALFRHSIATVY